MTWELRSEKVCSAYAPSGSLQCIYPSPSTGGKYNSNFLWLWFSSCIYTWNAPHNHDLYIYNEAKMPEQELIVLHYLSVWLHPSILQLARYLYHFYAIQTSGCNCHVGISDVESHMNAAIWLKQPYMYRLNPGFFSTTRYITSVIYIRHHLRSQV